MHPWEMIINIKLRPLTNGQWLATIVRPNQPKGKRILCQANGDWQRDAINGALFIWDKYLKEHEEEKE